MAAPTARPGRPRPPMSAKRKGTAGPVGRGTTPLWAARARRSSDPGELPDEAVQSERAQREGARVPRLPIELATIRGGPCPGRVATREPGTFAELVRRRLAGPGQVPQDLALRRL